MQELTLLRGLVSLGASSVAAKPDDPGLPTLKWRVGVSLNEVYKTWTA